MRETKKLIGDSEEFRLNGAEFSGRNTGKTIRLVGLVVLALAEQSLR